MLQKDKIIKEFEENKLKDNYIINELKADLDLAKKKLIMTQEETRDIQKENFESRTRNESSLEVISSLKDQIVNTST